MADDDAKALAQRLRDEIAKITGSKPQDNADSPRSKSLNDRIEERMRELERDEQAKKPDK